MKNINTESTEEVKIESFNMNHRDTKGTKLEKEDALSYKIIGAAKNGFIIFCDLCAFVV